MDFISNLSVLAEVAGKHDWRNLLVSQINNRRLCMSLSAADRKWDYRNSSTENECPEVFLALSIRIQVYANRRINKHSIGEICSMENVHACPAGDGKRDDYSKQSCQLSKTTQKQSRFQTLWRVYSFKFRFSEIRKDRGNGFSLYNLPITVNIQVSECQFYVLVAISS